MGTRGVDGSSHFMRRFPRLRGVFSLVLYACSHLMMFVWFLDCIFCIHLLAVACCSLCNVESHVLTESMHNDGSISLHFRSQSHPRPPRGMRVTKKKTWRLTYLPPSSTRRTLLHRLQLTITKILRCVCALSLLVGSFSLSGSPLFFFLHPSTR